MSVVARPLNIVETKEAIRDRYGRFAERGGRREACCRSGELADACCGYAVGEGLYTDADLALVPAGAVDLSRGCGNPTGFAGLRPGEVVFDFGCGGGIDVLLAALKVGADGKVIGIDFSPEMIERAKEKVGEAGVQDRVKLLAADLADTALPHASADAIISNCVFNLCPDIDAVYQEVFRVLRPGGRLAVSDIIFTEAIAPEVQARLRSTSAGCLAWAIPEAAYLELVRSSGFSDLHIVTCHRLGAHEVEAMACCPGRDFSQPVDERDLAAVKGKMASIKFTAVKPT